MRLSPDTRRALAPGCPRTPKRETAGLRESRGIRGSAASRLSLNPPRQLDHQAASGGRSGVRSRGNELLVSAALEILTHQADFDIGSGPVTDPCVQARVAGYGYCPEGAGIEDGGVELQPPRQIQIRPELDLMSRALPLYGQAGGIAAGRVETHVEPQPRIAGDQAPSSRHVPVGSRFESPGLAPHPVGMAQWDNQVRRPRGALDVRTPRLVGR